MEDKGSSRASQGAGDSTLRLSARGGPVPPLPILTPSRTPAAPSGTLAVARGAMGGCWGLLGGCLPLDNAARAEPWCCHHPVPQDLSPSHPRATRRCPSEQCNRDTRQDTESRRRAGHGHRQPEPAVPARAPSAAPSSQPLCPATTPGMAMLTLQRDGVEGGHGPRAPAAGCGTPHPGGTAVFLLQGAKPSPVPSGAARSWAPARDRLRGL